MRLKSRRGVAPSKVSFARSLAMQQLEERLVLSGASGDFDNNGSIDGGDFLAWQRTLGTVATPPGSGADSNGDGAVDAVDFGLWKQQFGGRLDSSIIVGDFDGNGSIDGSDFLRWQRTLGSTDQPTGSGADGNGDGVVNAADLGVWKQRLGAPSSDLKLDQFSGPASGLIDASISIATTVVNAGAAASGAFDVAYYLSADSQADGSDVALITVARASLPAGTSFSWTQSIDLPDSPLAGSYYIIAVVDPDDRVDELDENDNTARSAIAVRSGVAAEVIQGVLIVTGTEYRDRITLQHDFARGEIVVKDGAVAIKIYRANAIHAVQIVAGKADDVVDLHNTQQTALGVKAWVYAGGGNDVVYGGDVVDYIFGGEGVDLLFGGSGDDYLYGDGGPVNFLDGGAGADFLSVALNTRTNVGGGDVDIEAYPYAVREYFNLKHRNRDAWGFIVNNSGNPEDVNDAMIFTGLATTTAALNGDSQTTLELLTALRDRPWAVFGGINRLVRHPNSFDFVRSGGEILRERNQPVTKDGVLGVMSAAYYAYTAPGLSAEVREAARQTLGKYIDYLISNQWKTLDEYPLHYLEYYQDGKQKRFKNVFNEANEEGGNPTRKGPESFILSPTDIFALQNVGAKLGFVTSSWNPWETVAAAIPQFAGNAISQAFQAAGERLADWVGQHVDTLLRQVDVHQDYNFLWVSTSQVKVVQQSISFKLSDADRENIVAAVEFIIRSHINVYGEAADIALELPALLQQGNGIVGRVADLILDVAPDWLITDGIRDATTSALQQALPWLNGKIFEELIAFYVIGELSSHSDDDVVAHLSFWPTVLMYETRPDMALLLEPLVNDVHGYLNGKMDMLLFAWLAEDKGKVEEWLRVFEDDQRYNNLPYAWNRSKEDNATDIASGPATNPFYSRLDYLLLKALESHGVPDGLFDITGNWLEHWRRMMQDAANDLKAQAERAIEDLGEYIKERWDAAETYFKEKWDSAGSYAIEKIESAGAYVNERWDAAGNYVLERGDAVGATYTEARDAAGKLVSKGWKSSAQWIAQQFNPATGDLLEERIRDGIGGILRQWQKWEDGVLTDIEKFNEQGQKVYNAFKEGVQWYFQDLNPQNGQILEERIRDGIGGVLRQWQKWEDGVLTDIEKFNEQGQKVYNAFKNGVQWYFQDLNPQTGQILEERIRDGIGGILRQWQKWEDGVLTDIEKFNEQGQKVYNAFKNGVQWYFQDLNPQTGQILEERIRDGIGGILRQWQKWEDGVLTDIEKFNEQGQKFYNAFKNGVQWYFQDLNPQNGQILEERIRDGIGGILRQWQKWEDGVLTDIEKFNEQGQKFYNAFKSGVEWVYQDLDPVNGDKLAERIRDGLGGRLLRTKWLNDSGKWISQHLDVDGNVIAQYDYFGKAGSLLERWRTWTSSGTMTNLERYVQSGGTIIISLNAWRDSAGNWYEENWSNGVRTAIYKWNQAGTYVGNVIGSVSNTLSKLDPSGWF